MNFDRLVIEKGRFPQFQRDSVERLQNQVVTLGFLSKQIPAHLISNHLARFLLDETGDSVVLVRLEPHNGSTTHFDRYAGTTTAVDWAPSEVILQGQVSGPSTFFKTDAGFHILTLGVRSEPALQEDFSSVLTQLRGQFRYVLVEAQLEEIPQKTLLEFLSLSSPGFLFLRPAKSDVYRLNEVISGARSRTLPGKCLKPIVCLADGEDIDGFDALIQSIAGPVHMFIHHCPAGPDVAQNIVSAEPPTRFCKDVRRIAREIGGRLVGLALSSGAAKGFSHIGVLQVLEENGLEPDIVAGASMGAYVGSVWAYGCDGQQMEKLAREMEGRWAFWSLLDPVFPPRQGFLRGRAAKKRLMRSIGHARFADLLRPLRVVAGNLETLERTVFASGEVATATHASFAVPGICVPVTIDGETYVDGGIVDPLPVDVLRELGASRIIAVNAIPTPDRLRYGRQAERALARAEDEEKPVRALIEKVLPIEKNLNYFARGNLFEILMRSVLGAQVRVAEASCASADVVLRPDVCDDRWIDCRNPRRFIALGREVAERHLSELKALFQRKEIKHECEFAPESVAALA